MRLPRPSSILLESTITIPFFLFVAILSVAPRHGFSFTTLQQQRQQQQRRAMIVPTALRRSVRASSTSSSSSGSSISSSRLDDDDMEVVDDDDEMDWLRFASMDVVYGAGTSERLDQATVALIGVGSVGSWAAEALARSGVGTLVLIDLEDICVSQTTSTLTSLTTDMGQFKVDVLRERLRNIHPTMKVHVIYDFVKVNMNDNDENDDGTDVVVDSSTHTILDTFVQNELQETFNATLALDCIDQVEDKVAFWQACHKSNITTMTIGSATGRIDPTQVIYTNNLQDPQLANDALLQECQQYLTDTTSTSSTASNGLCDTIHCIASTETPRMTTTTTAPAGNTPTTASLCTVTGSFGLLASSKILDLLLLENNDC